MTALTYCDSSVYRTVCLKSRPAVLDLSEVTTTFFLTASSSSFLMAKCKHTMEHYQTKTSRTVNTA